MKLRFLAIAATLSFATSLVPLRGDKPVLSSLLGENEKKKALVSNDTRVDVELVNFGKQIALRITNNETGSEQLLVKNASGQWVPVYKARHRILNNVISFSKIIFLLGTGGLIGAYTLYHQGEDGPDGKRLVPTVATLLKKLIALIPSGPEEK